MASAMAVSPLKYEDLSRTSVTVIAAAGSIGFRSALASDVAVMIAAKTRTATASPRAGPFEGGEDDISCPIPEAREECLADASSSCLTYLIVWSDVCPTRDFGASSVPLSIHVAARPLRSSSSPTRAPLHTSALDTGEESFGPRPPRRRVHASSLRLVEVCELHVAAGERGRIVESRDRLDGAEELIFGFRPLPALREYKAEVRPGRGHGERIPRGVRKGQRAFRMGRGGFDGLHA